MDEVIKMVISVDEKANDIMKRTQEYLETRERDIRSKIEAIRSEIMDKTRSDAKTLYENTIKEAEMEAEKIKDSAEKECRSLESRFMKLREKLGGQLFSQIFK